MATGSSTQPSPELSLRRALRDDHGALCRLLDRYYREWKVQQRDPSERIAEYLNLPLPYGFVVAEKAGEIVGCVLLRPLPAISSATECKRLYVRPDCRGHHLASRLMDYAERLATESALSWIYLDTGAEFTAAQTLYRNRGYEACKRFNDNPQATFFFRKHLGE